MRGSRVLVVKQIQLVLAILAPCNFKSEKLSKQFFATPFLKETFEECINVSSVLDIKQTF